ncbi:MAG: enoyl-CoA hydratase/isomerase family protein [Deltaproteobacteria bacterium]|nr:MAG: enoyl-CoA hydratase/isomerase family protein [Deltaproteobacteria bacterium]
MTTRDALSAPETLPGGLVTWQAGGGIALITLTNPPVNGYSHEMMLDLDQAILRARFDDAVHVLVVAGQGERFFCAGADIKALQAMAPTFKYQFCLHANETLLRLEHTSKLTIAALGGHCVGGGLEVALACDLRVARSGSGKLGLPEVALGVLPGTGGTQRFARAVGRAKAIELMTTGDLLTFEQAAELGLVNAQLQAESEADFLDQVLAYASTFCPPKRASMAVGLIKRAVQTGLELPLEQGLALERELQARLFATDDAAEGLTAYVERRPPSFKGR